MEHSLLESITNSWKNSLMYITYAEYIELSAFARLYVSDVYHTFSF